MQIRKRLTVVLLLIASIYPFLAESQNLRGKVIYISTSQEVLLKFRSRIINFNITPKQAASLFEKRIANNKNLSISSNAENFPITSLAIIEGENTHHFILQYKPKLDPETESLYDFSTKEKLKTEVEKFLNGPTEPLTKPAVYTNTKVNSATQVVTPAQQTSSQTTADRYYDLTLKANLAFSMKNFSEAKDYYTKALEYRSNDAWCISQIKRIDDQKNSSIVQDQQKDADRAYQKHILIADSAWANKAYDKAKTAYEDAIREKPADPYAKEQLSKVYLALQEDSYKNLISLGADALRNQLLDMAQSAYEEALKIKPNDSEANKGLAKVTAAKNSMSANQEKQIEANRKLLQYENSKQYNLAIKQGSAALSNADYKVARDFFLQAQELNPQATLPLTQLQLIDAKLAEQFEEERYDEFIHLGDSSYVVKDFKSALSWYDSARKLRPNATLPRRQIIAVNQELLTIAEITRKKKRTDAFNDALPYYKKADTLRSHQRYGEAFTNYAEFLGRLDTTAYNEYQGSEQLYITKAKEYLTRLERYKPQPKIKVDAVASPIIEDNGKKKKKKKNT